MELLLMIPVGVAVLVGLALMSVFFELFVYGGMILLAIAFVVELVKAVVGVVI